MKKSAYNKLKADMKKSAEIMKRREEMRELRRLKRKEMREKNMIAAKPLPIKPKTTRELLKGA